MGRTRPQTSQKTHQRPKAFWLSIIIAFSFTLGSFHDSNGETFKEARERYEQNSAKNKTKKEKAKEDKRNELKKLYDRYLKVKEIWKSPFFQKIITIGTDKKFNKHLGRAYDRFDYLYFILAQIGLFILFFIFRSWRSSKVHKWWQKLWVSFYCSIIYLFIAVFGIPLAIIGSPFWKMLVRAWKLI